jgi:hypothetical protein
MTVKKVTVKDLTPKKTSAPVKVGSFGFGTGRGNDNITLVRAAKPISKRDLPPKSTSAVKGGKRVD